MMREHRTQQQIRAVLNASGTSTRVWRNNVGKRKVDGRWLVWGLAPGSADLIGIHRVIITPDMVGEEFGRFLSVEVKAESGGVIADEQVIWQDTVRRFGGEAFIWNSPELARAFLAGEGKHEY